MSLQEVEDLVLSLSDVQDLYIIQLELTKKLSLLHKKIHEVPFDNESQRNLIRTDISWAEQLKSICDKKYNQLVNESAKFNRSFRMVAEKKLTKQLYNQLCEEAKKL